MFVIINIVLPQAIDNKATKVYEEMMELNFNPREIFGR
jgi:hypothetical protein